MKNYVTVLNLNWISAIVFALNIKAVVR